MKQVNPYLLYQLALAMKPISDLKSGVTIGEAYQPMFVGREWLKWFFTLQLVPLPITKPVGQQLYAAINVVFPEGNYPFAADRNSLPINAVQLTNIQNILRELETLLNNELQRADIYAISQKGIYSTPDLIENATNALPPQIRSSISEQTQADINSAGRCLAFDLPTASGFHIMRATESILVEYYIQFVGRKTRTRNWGTYVADLKGTQANQKVVSIIDQIRELHRNPTIHPAVVLSEDEATTLFTIALSAIIAMKNDLLAARAKQTSSEPASQSEPGNNAP